MYVLKKKEREHSRGSSLVLQWLGFHCHGPGFNQPLLGELRFCKLLVVAKNKKIKKEERERTTLQEHQMWASADATQKVFTSGLTTVGLTVKLQSPVSLLSTPQAGTGKNPTGEKIRMQGTIAQPLRGCTLESGIPFQA